MISRNTSRQIYSVHSTVLQATDSNGVAKWRYNCERITQTNTQLRLNNTATSFPAVSFHWFVSRPRKFCLRNRSTVLPTDCHSCQTYRNSIVWLYHGHSSAIDRVLMSPRSETSHCIGTRIILSAQPFHLLRARANPSTILSRDNELGRINSLHFARYTTTKRRKST